MQKLWKYINPLNHLGNKDYSLVIPVAFSTLISVFSEVYVYKIIDNPNAVGSFIIFVHVAMIIYFAFRFGIKGGLGFTFSAIIYYFYIIYSRNYVGDRLTSGINTTIILLGLYSLIATTIGSLKQKIDDLIDKEANEKKWLQSVMDQLPVGIIITDRQGNTVRINKKLKSYFGSKARNNLSQNIQEVSGLTTIKNTPIKNSEWPIIKAITTGVNSPKQEFLYKNKNGKLLYFVVGTSIIRDKQDQIIASASIFTNITSRKELEQRKDEFINMASHELKTPITSLQLYIESLRIHLKTSTDKKSMAIIKNIKVQVGRIHDLVSTLLDVTRIQSGKLVINKSKLNLSDLVTKAVQASQKITNKHKLKFNKTKPIYVMADKFKIHQVLDNLLNNAIKYSPQGGDIRVSISRDVKYARVEIQDQGIGISKTQQKKVFEKLYQAPIENLGMNKGLGLGLYISSEIIKKHKGRIGVKSIVNEGSTFYFTLPLSK